MLEFRCGWVAVVSVLQAEAQVVLNMFRTLMYPSSGTYDYSVELPHWSCFLASNCVGISVWLDWSGIRIAGLSGACDYSVQLPHWSYCSWFELCWNFGVVGLEWYPCCRLKLPGPSNNNGNYINTLHTES